MADYVLTPRGKLVSGISLTDHFNTLVAGVVQMQIVQEEVDRFVFRIVRGPEFGSASLEQIRAGWGALRPGDPLRVQLRRFHSPGAVRQVSLLHIQGGEDVCHDLRVDGADD